PNSNNYIANCRSFAKEGHSLYQILLENTLRQLPSSVQRLLIIPDDLLSYLPFGILLQKAVDPEIKNYDPKQFQYLLGQYTLSYHYSATLLLQHRQNNDPKQQALKSFIGFAPSFGQQVGDQQRQSCTSDNIYSLQCNQQEVESIEALISGKTYLAQSANKSNFANEAAQYRIIHLATHACVDDQDNMLNKIWFSDDYLSNYDLVNIPLQADLVVLSACNTGYGKLIKGEGVMSLARGFILAGCPSTLMSLWAVDDCSTSGIMVRFYENLRAGKTKDEALRQAKLEHIKSADKANAHPYYWAAFVQFGDAQAMIWPEHFFSSTTGSYLLGLVLILSLSLLLKRFR
ncbi:MAG: CHAT domain-containing protein, partial [Bacteroidota bacterium]